MLKISEDDFQRLTHFVKKHYGVNLTAKKHLIESRLGGVVAGMGFTDFNHYVEHIISDPKKLDLQILMERLTTNHTYFMREADHFDFFQEYILPRLEKNCKRRSLSIWSAGCSTGEEPYTLAMVLEDYFGRKIPPWDTRILATDISRQVLDTARKGVYKAENVQTLPWMWLDKYFIKEEDCYAVAPTIKKNVIYREFNLMGAIQFKIPFDVIFCRNVMIYFDRETKEALVDRFYSALNPGGYLIVGHAEALNPANLKFEQLTSSIYRKS